MLAALLLCALPPATALAESGQVSSDRVYEPHSQPPARPYLGETVPRSYRPVAYSLGGAAAVMLGTGTYLYFHTQGLRDAASSARADACGRVDGRGACTADFDRLRDYERHEADAQVTWFWSRALLAAGATSAAASVVFFLLEPDHEPGALALRPMAQPASAGVMLTGAF